MVDEGAVSIPVPIIHMYFNGAFVLIPDMERCMGTNNGVDGNFYYGLMYGNGRMDGNR